MAKKKSANSRRVAEHRARMRESGYRNVAVLLPPKAIDRLNRLVKSSGQTKAEVIAELLLEPKPQPKGGNCSLCGQWMPDSELSELLRGKDRYKVAQCKNHVACFQKRY